MSLVIIGSILDLVSFLSFWSYMSFPPPSWTCFNYEEIILNTEAFLLPFDMKLKNLQDRDEVQRLKTTSKSYRWLLNVKNT